MALKIALDFNVLLDYIEDSSNPSISIQFTEIDDYENIVLENINRMILNVYPAGSINGKIDLAVYNNNVLIEHGDETELDRIIEDLADPVFISGNVNSYNSLNSLMLIDAANLDFNGLSSIVLYKQNSANNVVNKNLTIVRIIQGKFNIPIALKTFTLDLQSLPFFNYIRVPILDNRYYYVNSVQRYTDVLTRYTFGEDVLMTWQDLIKSQSAFIIRQENNNEKERLIDNRLPVTDTVYYHVFNPNMLGEKNVTFDFEPVIPASGGGYTKNNYNILVSTYTKELYTSLNLDNIESPDLVLPSISPLRNRSNFKSLISLSNYGALVNACVKDDVTASFVQSVLWLPFKATDIFNTQLSSKGVYANGKVLCGINGGEWQNNGSENSPVDGYWIFDGVSPYLVIADFMFNDTGIGDTNLGIASYSPISKWEIYVPFVGWQEVDFNAVKGKRIFVFYAMDLDTGLSTAYIYNKTDSIILWSGTCQIGIRLNLVTTNELENTRQKQANDLNMILGTIGAGLSIAVGAASGNGFAVAAGALTATKTIASAVNSNNMLFERASMSFGTSNTALYSKTEVQVRRSYHELLPKDDTVYGRINGYPANSYEVLSNLSGYTEIGDIHFNPMNYDITQDEINEIVAILRNGVIM